MDGDDDSGLNAGQEGYFHDDSDVDLERGSGRDGEGEGEGEEVDGEGEETAARAARRAAASKVAENLATARSYIGRQSGPCCAEPGTTGCWRELYSSWQASI